MKEPSERARVLLERYKTVESLSSAHKERLLAKLENAVARGASPQFDDDGATPMAVPPSWFQRAWAAPLFRPLILICLVALPAVAAVGIARRLTPARVVPPPAPAHPAPARPAPIGPTAPRPAVEAPDTEIAPLVAPKHSATLSPTRSTPPRSTHAPATDATIDGEMRLLKEAQAAGADGNWQRALRLLDEYAVRFPAGRLADVRAVAHLTALCKLGQTTMARSEAERFLVRYPNSPFTDRVKRVCATTADP
ncbi:MAG: hypothetical protein QOI66_4155 [Myxococcales bacterium]|jgi:hypothetical protein|nr:hypothetical protein [Myxococcales bacterium]